MYVCVYVPHYSYLIVPCKIIFGDLPSRCVQARLLSLLASLSLSERTLAGNAAPTVVAGSTGDFVLGSATSTDPHRTYLSHVQPMVLAYLPTKLGDF